MVTAVKINNTMYAEWLNLVDACIYQFELVAATPSSRPSSDAVYQTSSGGLLMKNLVLNNTKQRLKVEMTTVDNMETAILFTLKSQTISPD